MNASPYHSKVRVSLKFADTQFAAGGSVTGKVELECKAEKGLGIGVIMVELYAIEGTQCPLQSRLYVRVELGAACRLYEVLGCALELSQWSPSQ